ncbi:MAG: L,D-transpeptidase family protein [Candidatus Omnitrophica bacterium]|nr:L,D-transpeptidase family protein [Candidatus Omnitrophota bacterium]
MSLGLAGAAILLLGFGIVALRRPPISVEGGIPEAPSSDAPAARVLFAQAERARVQGSLLDAKQLYQQILQQMPTSEAATAAQQRLGEVNLKLIFSPTLTPGSVTYLVQPGDTLTKIAKEFHTTIDLLKIANGLTSDRIRPEQRLKVTKANFSVVVDKSQNTLVLKNDEEVLRVYRCSTGAGGNTPTGKFKIVNRIVNPPWFTPQGMIPAGDPRNVLGSRWMGFDQPGYGIHGTTDPASIGKAVTQGCVRLANAEVEELFILLPEGTSVIIVD